MSLELIFKEIDANYAIDQTAALTTRFWWVPVTAVCCYLTLIALGKKWMSNKEPYHLRGPLFVWNLLLAVFSILGAAVMVPPLWRTLTEQGFEYSVCYTTIHTFPMQSFFSLLFVLSKIVEFGDTVFVVLRKNPLNFLHWYHHVTVCFYSWHSLAIKSAPAHWFCALNYLVHSVMYSYYMLKSTGVRVWKEVALGITALQMVQFVVGLIVVCESAYVFVIRGDFCYINRANIVMGLVIYASYLVLFGNFFYQRYLKAPPSKKVQ